MTKPITMSCTLLLSLLAATHVSAACTYSEALMALNNGNLVRGQALMNMAARDGDLRATRFIASFDPAKLSVSELRETLQTIASVASNSTGDIRDKKVDITAANVKVVNSTSERNKKDDNPDRNLLLVKDAATSTHAVN